MQGIENVNYKSQNVNEQIVIIFFL